MQIDRVGFLDGLQFFLESDLERNLWYSTVLSGTYAHTWDGLKCSKNQTQALDIAFALVLSTNLISI